MEIIIPFAGFYNSIHDSELDQTLEQAFSDRDTGCHVNKDLASRVHGACNWSAVFVDYASEYAEQFAEKFKIKLTFAKLISPKFYNFETDRILCNIEFAEVKRIFDLTDKAILDKIAAEQFTSRDGFSSFYSPDVADWGNLTEWDCNHVGALLAAYVEQEHGDFDQYAELSLMESASSNGRIISMIDSATPNIERFYKIMDYIEDRKAR